MTVSLPIGYHATHPDVSLNFQMNRWFSWVGDVGMLDEMRTVAPRVTTYADWQREFAALAQQALARGQNLKAAYYLRAAEFFLLAGDPQRKPMRENFVLLTREYYGVQSGDQHRVPYSDGFPMTHEWEKPVAAVLDHFGLDDVTLIGLSMGGYLVIRAAAFEPRVRRVIAYDVFFDSFDCNLRQMQRSIRMVLLVLLHLKLDLLVNALVRRAARRSMVIGWGLHHAMHVTGTTTPAAYLHAIQRYTAAEVSSRVMQDVLLLAGSEDHYVPVQQFYKQIAALKNARSLTARLFTQAESAQNHCQAGDYGLAFQVITAWLDSQAARAQQG